MFCGHSVCCNWSSCCCCCCCWFVVLFASFSHACHVLRFDVVPAHSPHAPCLNKLKVIKTSKAKAKERNTNTERKHYKFAHGEGYKCCLYILLNWTQRKPLSHTETVTHSHTHKHTAQVCKYFMQKHKHTDKYSHTHTHT